MGRYELQRHTMRITDDDAWKEFTKVANENGYGLGKKSSTYWDFVVVLLDFYKRHNAIDNVFDRIEMKIRDIRAITPQKIQEIVRQTMKEDLPVIMKACVRDELERFDQDGEP